MQIEGFWTRLKFLIGWAMPAKPEPENVERRIQARLAWNGWPDSANARKLIAEHEARDQQSAAAWDRVIKAVHQPLDGFVLVPKRTDEKNAKGRGFRARAHAPKQ